MSMQTKLVGHHVGGRNASVSFLPPAPFHGDFVSVLYDADEDCVEQILEKTAELDYEVMAFPYCLGAAPGKATLNINYCSYTSSLLELSDQYGGFYEFSEPMDYVYSDTMRTMERFNVDVVDMDSLIAQDRVGMPPDFLSLDVEGVELDILQGASKTLERHVLGLVTEVTFLEIRKGQQLFDVVRPKLDANGFDFVRFTYLHEFSPVRGRVGSRGVGYQLVGDALFIRRIETIPQMTSDPAEQYLLAVKLAYIATHWGLLEYGHAARTWAMALDVDNAVRRTVEETSYGRFVAQLSTAIEGIPNAYPPLFSEVMDYETSRSRSRPTALNTHTGWKRDLKNWLLAHPSLFGLLRRARYAMWSLRDAAKAALRRLGDLGTPRWSEVETVLRDHGFGDIAAHVRHRRLSEQPFIRHRT